MPILKGTALASAVALTFKIKAAAVAVTNTAYLTSALKNNLNVR